VELNNYCSLPSAGIIRQLDEKGFNDRKQEVHIKNKKFWKELIAYFPLMRRRRGRLISKQINALGVNKNVLARDNSNLPLCYAMLCYAMLSGIMGGIHRHTDIKVTS
jgi:hypothetical protein